MTCEKPTICPCDPATPARPDPTTMPKGTPADTVSVPEFREGEYVFPDSTATLQPQRVENGALHYDGFLTKEGKTTGKVFFSFSFTDDVNYKVILDKAASGAKNYSALVQDGSYLDNIQEAVEAAIYDKKKDKLDLFLNNDEEDDTKAMAIFKQSESPVDDPPLLSLLNDVKTGAKKRKSMKMTEIQSETAKITGLNTRITHLLGRIEDMKTENQAGKLSAEMKEYRLNISNYGKEHKQTGPVTKVLDAVTQLMDTREKWTGFTYDTKKVTSKSEKTVQRACLTDLADLLRLTARYITAPNKDLLLAECKDLIKVRSTRSRRLADLKDTEQLKQLGLKAKDVF